MKRSTILSTLLGALALAVPQVEAQNVAVKTNLIYDALANINLGIEGKLAPRWTIDVNGNFNDWTFSGGKRWKHWMAQPEIRYWFCEAMHGNFIGLELHGGQYNIGKVNTNFDFLGTNFKNLKDTRYQGWYAGAGITYGHAWMLAKHWNIEAELGIGWSYTRFDRYPCASCGSKIEDNAVHNYFGLTKAALNLVYIF
ncbi:MAG: DUF3575 domain-containing protein [Bacteroidales bacterium]|nr:DUF3575 domain-containing protein [Bacteroidales bacterium]MDE7464832.1 DUF3575 domain-containing protein [Muribaculaceae bacterium]